MPCVSACLSSGIRKLETEFHVSIIKRGQRFEGFTAEGQVVLDWARQVLAERTSLGQTLTNMREGLSGTLRIGAIPPRSPSRRCSPRR